MRSLIPAFALFVVTVLGCSPQAACTQSAPRSESDRVLRRALEEHTSDLQVEGQGVVKRLLPDDNDGSKHQRFILELDSGQTLLIAHNVDIAPRIDGLRKGDKVEFRGEYDWNSQGGVVHWTHHAPSGRHPDGWLKHKGKTYE